MLTPSCGQHLGRARLARTGRDCRAWPPARRRRPRRSRPRSRCCRCRRRRRRCRRCRSHPPVPRSVTIRSRRLRAPAVISSTVSPRTRSAISRPATWAGVALPVIISANASPASASLERRAGGGLADQLLEALQLGGHARPPTSASARKFLQDAVAVLGLDALGMELDAVDRQARVAQAHDRAVGGARIDLELGRHGLGLGRQRMVAGGGERRRQVGEHAGPVVLDRAQLAVHHLPRAADRGAERLGDRLVAEADAQDRDAAGGGADQRQRDAGAVGIAGPGRDHDRVGRHGDRILHRQRVVAVDDGLGPELAQIVDEVVGEAVVVIDQEQHRLARPGRAWRRPRAREPHRGPRRQAPCRAGRRASGWCSAGTVHGRRGPACALRERRGGLICSKVSPFGRRSRRWSAWTARVGRGPATCRAVARRLGRRLRRALELAQHRRGAR